MQAAAECMEALLSSLASQAGGHRTGRACPLLPSVGSEPGLHSPSGSESRGQAVSAAGLVSRIESETESKPLPLVLTPATSLSQKLIH